MEETKKMFDRFNNKQIYNECVIPLITPLFKNKRNNAVECILKNKYDVNEKDYFNGNTVLNWAVHNSAIDSALYLIERRDTFNPPLNIRSQDDDGYTSLMSAIEKGYKRCNENDCEKFKLNMGLFIDKYILSSPFDYFEIRNDAGNTAFEIALKLYDLDTIKTFIKYHKSNFEKVLKKDYIKCIIKNYYEIDNLNLDYLSNGISANPTYYQINKKFNEKLVDELINNKNEIIKLFNDINSNNENQKGGFFDNNFNDYFDDNSVDYKLKYKSMKEKYIEFKNNLFN